MKCIRILAVIMAMCLLFIGCGKEEDVQSPDTQTPTDNSGVPVETEPQELTFRYNGAVMTLPSDFTDYTQSPIAADYTFLYADAMTGVFGIENRKEEVDPSITSLEGYAAAQAAKFGVEAVQQEGVWTAVYEDLTQNEPQMLVCAFYETQGAYWTVQSYCTSDMYETFETTLWGYVKAVTFE